MTYPDPQIRVADTRCETGEGPIWHPDAECLYWADIPNGQLYRYDPTSDDHERVLDGDDAIGGYTIQIDGSLLLFRAGGRIEYFDPKNGVPTTITTVNDATHTRFNDVIADPEGRVFAGTMPTNNRLGHLYRVDTDGSVVRVCDYGYDVPNGMGFSPDLETLYVTESEASAIYSFDYDRKTGAATDRRTLLDLSDETGIPDGMTVDATGDIWSARWGGGVLVRYASDGSERERFDFPAKKVSSVTFAGSDYRDVYVTTAGGSNRRVEGDGAGALFRFSAPRGVTGRPEFRSAISVK